jgi:hypothetical protein
MLCPFVDVFPPSKFPLENFSSSHVYMCVKQSFSAGSVFRHFIVGLLLCSKSAYKLQSLCFLWEDFCFSIFGFAEQERGIRAVISSSDQTLVVLI